MKSWLTGKDPDEKTEGKRRKGQERIRWLDTITNLMDTNLSEVCETVEDRGAWRVAVHGFAKSWTRLSDWKITTATMATIFLVCFFFKDGSYCSPQRVHQNTFPPCLVRVRGRPQASPVSLWTPSNDPLTMMWSICHQHKECPGRSAYICNLKILYLLLITWKLNERNVCDKRKSPWELFFFFSYGRPFWLKRKQKKIFYCTSRQSEWLVFCLSKSYQWSFLRTAPTALPATWSSLPSSVLVRWDPSLPPQSITASVLAFPEVSLSEWQVSPWHRALTWNLQSFQVGRRLVPSMKPSLVTLNPTSLPLTLAYNLVQ